MSARAAARLEVLGFEQVFRYTPGKADWLANGLPREGRDAARPTVAAALRDDVPTCRLGERVGAVRERVRSAGWDVGVVLDENRVVLGRFGRRAMEADPEARVEEAMTPGPRTFRVGMKLEAAVRRMRDRDLPRVVVTTTDGRLVGMVAREDGERYLAQGPLE